MLFQGWARALLQTGEQLQNRKSHCLMGQRCYSRWRRGRPGDGRHAMNDLPKELIERQGIDANGHPSLFGNAGNDVPPDGLRIHQHRVPREWTDCGLGQDSLGQKAMRRLVVRPDDDIHCHGSGGQRDAPERLTWDPTVKEHPSDSVSDQLDLRHHPPSYESEHQRSLRLNRRLPVPRNDVAGNVVNMRMTSSPGS